MRTLSLFTLLLISMSSAHSACKAWDIVKKLSGFGYRERVTLTYNDYFAKKTKGEVIVIKGRDAEKIYRYFQAIEFDQTGRSEEVYGGGANAESGSGLYGYDLGRLRLSRIHIRYFKEKQEEQTFEVLFLLEKFTPLEIKNKLKNFYSKGILSKDTFEKLMIQISSI